MLQKHLKLNITKTEDIISFCLSFLLAVLPLNFPVSAIYPFVQVGKGILSLDLLFQSSPTPNQILSLVN